MSDAEKIFLYNQQMLAYEVARLPLLRRNLLVARQQVKDGFLGNSVGAQREYDACVTNIQAIARGMV